MTDQPVEKTESEKLRDIISQLKEMHHHAETNITKLSAILAAIRWKEGEKGSCEEIRGITFPRECFS